MTSLYDTMSHIRRYSRHHGRGDKRLKRVIMKRGTKKEQILLHHESDVTSPPRPLGESAELKMTTCPLCCFKIASRSNDLADIHKHVVKNQGMMVITGF